MHIINKMAQHQQRKIQKHITASNSCRFFNQLTSPALLATVDNLLPEHRERCYPPTETLSMFLAQALSADRSCQYAVNHALVQRVAHGLPALSVSTGAYRARKRLPLDMVHATGALLEARSPTEWRWKEKSKKKPDWITQEAYECAPETLTIRELNINGKILITTYLSTQEATRDELKTLYKKRWNIEVDFRNLKTTMGMDVLSCKTPDMIEKEIWIYLLVYNLIRSLMAQAALPIIYRRARSVLNMHYNYG